MVLLQVGAIIIVSESFIVQGTPVPLMVTMEVGTQERVWLCSVVNGPGHVRSQPASGAHSPAPLRSARAKGEREMLLVGLRLHKITC